MLNKLGDSIKTVRINILKKKYNINNKVIIAIYTEIYFYQ